MLVLKRLLSMLGRASTLRDVTLLVALCAAVYLPGLRAIAAVDRDEARFAQASRQMFEAAALPVEAREARLHGGGWAVPYLGEVARLNKPPLVYWMQVASAWVMTGGRPERDAIWMYRIPSVLAAVGTVLLTRRLGNQMFGAGAGGGAGGVGGRGIGTMAAALLAVSPIFVWDAHQARADQVMVFFTMAAVCALYRCLTDVLGAKSGGRSARLGPALVLHAAIAAGVMTKGPITLMVVVLAVVTAAFWMRSWRWIAGLRPGLLAVMLAGAAGPWLWSVAQQQGGLGVYVRGVWDEFFVRAATGSKEGHFWPPGFHTVMLAVLFWPGSLVTLAAVGGAWREVFATAGRDDRTGGARDGGGVMGRVWGAGRGLVLARAGGFSPALLRLAVIGPSWLLFELSPAKLLHYTMPLYPLVAIVTARALLTGVVAGLAGRVIWWLVGGGPIVVMALGMVAMFAPSFAAGESPDAGTIWTRIVMLAAAGAALVFAIAAGSVVLRRRLASAMVVGTGLAIVSLVCMVGPLLAIVAPLLVPGRASEELRQVLEAVDPARARPWATTNLADSVGFATRAHAERIAKGDVGKWLEAHPGGLVIVPWDSERGGGARLPAGTREVGQAAVPGYQRMSGWVIVERER